MAVGKGRNKRLSGSSCASTTTTVVFVALCVLGVYMLTPSYLLSSDTTTTTRTAVSESSSQTTNSNQDTSTFQDNPGVLPKDAIKKDEDDNAKDSSSDQAAEFSNDDQTLAGKRDQLSDQAENLVTTAAAEIEHLDTKDQLAEENVKQQADEEQPCLDNEKALKKLRSRMHYQHRERHCPEEPPTCLVPLPQGYKTPVEWPQSRDKIWYHNVPHIMLAEVKGHQNWVKLSGEFLTFPGGGTQFIHGALHYIDFLQKAVPEIAWGKHTRTVLDVGCGVASFGGYLFDRDVLTISFAPKDEHEAQVQFALERGIPAISAVMGTQRLPFPSRVFDLIHCARCRVPWHIEGGALLLELNRMLRPGGYFVWSATPVYQKLKAVMQLYF